MTDTAEFNYLRKLVENMVSDINKEFVSIGQSFNIKEEIKGGTFSLQLTTRKPGISKVLVLQEFAITVRKDMPVFQQYTIMYKNMLRYINDN